MVTGKSGLRDDQNIALITCSNDLTLVKLTRGHGPVSQSTSRAPSRKERSKCGFLVSN